MGGASVPRTTAAITSGTSTWQQRGGGQGEGVGGETRPPGGHRWALPAGAANLPGGDHLNTSVERSETSAAAPVASDQPRLLPLGGGGGGGGGRGGGGRGGTDWSQMLQDLEMSSHDGSDDEEEKEEGEEWRRTVPSAAANLKRPRPTG